MRNSWPVPKGNHSTPAITRTEPKLLSHLHIYPLTRYIDTMILPQCDVQCTCVDRHGQNHLIHFVSVYSDRSGSQNTIWR